MKLVIAEKAEVARAISRAICGSESGKLPAFGNGYAVTAASGHLLELVEPQAYDKRLSYFDGDWGIDDLPIIFRDWKRDVKRGRDAKGKKTAKPDEKARERVEGIAKLLKDADMVINAGDPDDEGQCIVDELLEHLGYTGPVRRVYINDTIEKNIAREFEKMIPNAAPWQDGRVAYARAMADMVFGVNDTRLLSKRLGLRNVSVGRVQTPVLRMVVERDLAIERHEERHYYEIEAELSSAETGKVKARLAYSEDFLEEASEDGKHVFEKGHAEEAASAIEAQGRTTLTVERKPLKKHAPLPYTITQLEAEMSRLHGYTPAETLKVTQVLRDKYSAITYNRTSSPYLKEEHWAEAPATLGCAMENIGCAEWPLDFSLKSSAFDDGKCTAHHGIIPQEKKVDVSAMSEEEENVYRAIVVRYALQFLPPAVFDTCTADAPVAHGILKYKARKLVDPGWTAYAGKEREGDAEGHAEDGSRLLDAGTYECGITGTAVVQKKTSPPKRYTEETLLLDMASASKYVKDKKLRQVMLDKDADEPGEHGGIGTSATRHAIIEVLKRRGFIETKGRSVVSTPRGRAVYAILPEGLGTVDMTARWYLLQEEIRQGRADANLLAEAVADEFRKRKDTAYVGVDVPEALRGGKKAVGTCPRCGKQIISLKNSYQCESNKFSRADGKIVLVEGCGWSFGKVIAGKRLTDRQGEGIIAGKAVKVKGLTSSKTGKTYEATIRMSDPESAKLEFSFDDSPKRKPPRKR